MKILGGCCEANCDDLGIKLEEDNTEAGVVVYAVVDQGEAGCLAECEGNITNQGSEQVGITTGQAQGWSYFNEAHTVSNENSIQPFPESFETYAFDLVSGTGRAPRIESDVINLCPGQSYVVCYDHLGEFSSVISLSIDGQKVRETKVGTELGQSCMSFQATRSHHRVTIEGSEGLSLSLIHI